MSIYSISLLDTVFSKTCAIQKYYNLVEKNLQYHANGYEPTNIRLIYNWRNI